MKEQTDFFDPPPRARNSDPETSHEAAERIMSKLKKLQQRVYSALLLHREGLTDFELEGLFNNHGSTYRTRRSELVELGLVEDSGRRRFQNGGNRIVWRAK